MVKILTFPATPHPGDEGNRVTPVKMSEGNPVTPGNVPEKMPEETPLKANGVELPSKFANCASEMTGASFIASVFSSERFDQTDERSY